MAGRGCPMLTSADVPDLRVTLWDCEVEYLVGRSKSSPRDNRECSCVTGGHASDRYSSVLPSLTGTSAWYLYIENSSLTRPCVRDFGGARALVCSPMATVAALPALPVAPSSPLGMVKLVLFVVDDASTETVALVPSSVSSPFLR